MGGGLTGRANRIDVRRRLGGEGRVRKASPRCERVGAGPAVYAGYAGDAGYAEHARGGPGGIAVIPVVTMNRFSLRKGKSAFPGIQHAVLRDSHRT